LYLKPLNILRLALVVLQLLLLALAPARAQTIVSQGKITTLAVVQVPGHTYDWELYNDATINFATVAGNCPVTSATFSGSHLGSSVQVIWLMPGIYFYKVTARNALGCTMNLKIGMIRVIPTELDASIAGTTLTGACQQVKLDASKSIGDIIRYEWSLINNGGVLTNKLGITTDFQLSPSFTGSLPADFKVKLLVTNRKGVTNSDSITITVDRLPVAEIYASGKLEKDGTMVVDGTVSTGTALDYRWFSTAGKIVGPNNEPTVKLMAPGIYSLEITDNHGCKSTKSFKFPLEIHQIMANPDYARTSWAQDTTIMVLNNDQSTVALLPATVHILEQPTRGGTKVNADGSITYMPKVRNSGRDQFVYEVCDEVNLCASTTVTIDIYDSGINVPEGFSPNGDGINDQLVFKGLEHYLKSQLYIFTRSGQPVYHSLDYLNNWAGTTILSTMTSLELVPTGVYYYVLKLGGTNRSLKGFVYIGY